LFLASAALACLSLASGQTINFILRGFASFGGALATAPALALTREILPGKGAWVALSVLSGFFVLGAFSGRFALWFEEDLAMAQSPGHCDLGWVSMSTAATCSWKILAELSAIPAVLFFVAAGFQLSESPMFFAMVGKHVEANLLLRRVAVSNGKKFERLRFVPAAVNMPPPGGVSAALNSLARKDGVVALTAAVSLTSLVFWFFLIRLGAETDSRLPAAASVSVLVAGAFAVSPTLLKLRVSALLALAAAAWLHFGRPGGSALAAEVVLLCSLAVLKIAAELEICDFFPEDERVAGLAMIFGAASSVVSFFELAAHLVPMDPGQIYLPAAGAFSAAVVAALALAPRPQPLLSAAEEKQRLLN